MLIAAIDTSGKAASCAVCSENVVLAQRSFATQKTHSQVILPVMKATLADAGVTLEDCDGFAVVSGPGSYTGLRIGIAAVKGICMALDKKCAGISALESLAYNFSGTDSVICSVMHARQELVYTAMFETKAGGTVTRLTPDSIIPLPLLAEQLREKADSGKKIICAGDYSSEAVSAAEREGVTKASPQMNIQQAASLCFAAAERGFDTPDRLEAEYMQITKAEKDLMNR